MIHLPKVKKGVLAALPFTSFYMTRKQLEETIVSLARKYIALGGNPRLSIPAHTDLNTAALTLANALKKHISEQVLPTNTPRAGDIGLTIVDFDGERCEAEKIRTYPIRMGLLIELGYWIEVPIKCLADLQKKDKKMYAFVRALLLTVCTRWICSSQDEIFDMVCQWDMWDEEDEGEENDARDARKEMMEETSLFCKHFNFKRPLPKLQKLRKEWQTLQRKANKEQKAWVEAAFAAIEMIAEARSADNFLDPLDMGWDQFTPLEYSVGVVWDLDSRLMAMHRDYVNDQFGNFGGPLLLLRLSFNEDVAAARKVVMGVAAIINTFYLWHEDLWKI